MPWSNRSRPYFKPSPEPELNPKCAETCRLLEIYARDHRRVEVLLKTRGGSRRPEGFPTSQWKRIFKGEPVDLDVVFSSINCVMFDEERMASFGGKELSFTIPEAKRLLDLWDELGIPHKQKKQVHGSPLTIIGINVDPNSMTFTLPPAAKQHLIDKLKLWSTEPPKKVNGALLPGVRLHVHFKLR